MYPRMRITRMYSRKRVFSTCVTNTYLANTHSRKCICEFVFARHVFVRRAFANTFSRAWIYIYTHACAYLYVYTDVHVAYASKHWYRSWDVRQLIEVKSVCQSDWIYGDMHVCVRQYNFEPGLKTIGTPSLRDSSRSRK